MSDTYRNYFALSNRPWSNWVTDEAGKMLAQAGPGYIVIGASWRTKEGAFATVQRVFLEDTPPDEIDAWKRESGWPGHNGSQWNYFKDWVREKTQNLPGSHSASS